MSRTLLVLVLLTAACGARRDTRKGDAALAEGRVSVALRAYRSALERRPEDGRALLGLASALLADGDPDAALAPARAAHEAGVRGSEFVLARALLDVGQGASALPLLTEVEGPRADPEQLALRVEALLASGDLGGAASAASSLLETEDLPPAGRALAAWTLFRAGDARRAASEASLAAAGALDDPRVQAEAAAVLSGSGDAAGARGAAKAAIRLGASAPALSREAARRDQGGDREGAIRLLSWAAALDPDEGRIFADLGQLYLARGSAERAAAYLEQAVGLPPYKDPSVGGVTLARPQDWAESTRRQKLAEVLRALGRARLDTGDARGSAAALQQAAELAATGAAEWVAVADAWERAKVQSAVFKALERALALKPDDLQTRLRLARALRDAGQLGPAIGQARVAWEGAPRDVEAALLLGELYEARGERSAARDLYTTVLRAHPGESRLVEALRRTGG